MFITLVKRTTLGLLCLVFLVVLICLLSGLAHAQSKLQVELNGKNALGQGPGASGASAQSDLASKKVLILHSFAYAQPAYKIIDAALIESFVSSGLNFNNLYFEFLDLVRRIAFFPLRLIISIRLNTVRWI